MCSVGAHRAGRRNGRKEFVEMKSILFVLLICLFIFGCEKDTNKGVVENQQLVDYECPDSNVVLITIETTRADHLGCYGYNKNTTPFIDSIAKDGILFEKAFAPRGLTWVSLTSMLTSLYPISTDVRNNGQVLDYNKTQTMASILKSNGYVTAAFLTNFFEAGDYHFGMKYCGDDAFITDQAIQWIGKNKDQKFFIWMHYLAPHMSYEPPPKYDIFTDKNYRGTFDGSNKSLENVTLNKINLSYDDYKHIISLYDGEIFYVDNLIKSVYKALDNSGLTGKTIVVITADHGEDLYQHNYYFYHHCSIYDSSLHIPLIFKLPDNSYSGRRVDAIVENIDIFPTLLDMLKIKKHSPFQGNSMLPLFHSDFNDTFSVALSEYEKNMFTIRTQEWRYIYNPNNITPYGYPEGDYYKVGTEELYNHLTDPNEKDNVVAEYPEIAESLRNKLLNLYKPLTKEIAPSKEADEKTLEQLRSLGYLN